VRARSSVLIAIGIAALALGATAAQARPVDNPCEGPEARRLLCPNLRIGPPTDLYVQYNGADRILLRATSDVRSRGRGPMELRGRRTGWRTMRVNQRIYGVRGGHVTVHTDAKLHFTDVGERFGGSFWKVHGLARFELRRVRPDKGLGAVVRVGPKLNYCLRDLELTRAMARSPLSPHYPGCNQDPYRSHVTLGTSVGWSDIYPAEYDKQWINVAGLRGCYAFTMTVDPQQLLFESNERDNTSRRLVRLPYRGEPGC
jgi:hypothetical protein